MARKNSIGQALEHPPAARAERLLLVVVAAVLAHAAGAWRASPSQSCRRARRSGGGTVPTPTSDPSPSPRPGRYEAALPTKARSPPRWGEATGRRRRWRRRRCAMSATKLPSPRVEQVGVEVRGGGDLRAPPDPRAEQPQPRHRVERRVERVGERRLNSSSLSASHLRSPSAERTGWHARPVRGGTRPPPDGDHRADRQDEHRARQQRGHDRARAPTSPSSSRHTSSTAGTSIGDRERLQRRPAAQRGGEVPRPRRWPRAGARALGDAGVDRARARRGDPAQRRPAGTTSPRPSADCSASAAPRRSRARFEHGVGADDGAARRRDRRDRHPAVLDPPRAQ